MPTAQTQFLPINFINAYPQYIQSLLNGVMYGILFLLIVFIGWLIAMIIKIFVEYILIKSRLSDVIKEAGLDKYFASFHWETGLINVISEVIFWMIFVVFLSTAFSTIGFTQVVDLLNRFLAIVPVIIVGALLIFAGFVLGDLMKKIASGFLRGFDKKSAGIALLSIKWFFVIISVVMALNYVGISTNIIEIVFMGIVLAIGLAVGLAFGLGGQDVAREVLENIRNQIKSHHRE
ncbi:MAG: hypothetical protein QW786_01410 [Candidatus Hadarchaeum sp.]|nr:MAG: hypothetical protein KatS3mg097_389 [Candidatus Parcubacteria bacterium]